MAGEESIHTVGNSRPPQAWENEHAEMVQNYPLLKQYVSRQLQKETGCTLVDLTDENLESLAQSKQAQPLSAFIEDIEHLAEGS